MARNGFQADPIPIPLRQSIVHVDANGKISADPETGSPITRQWARHFQQITTTAEALQGQGYVIDGLHATRATIDPNTVPASTLYVETDRNVVYLGGTAWTYLAGVFQTSLGHQPLDLGPFDEGFLLRLADIDHLLRWTGAGWAFADGGNAFFQDFAVAPSGPGWQLCNGANTSYLTLMRGLALTPFTVPDLHTGAYRKSSNAYNGAIVTTGGNLTGAGAVDPSHINTLVYFRR